MKKSDQKITCGDFKALRRVIALTGIVGHWTKSTNHCQYRTENGAVLNYWKTTGRITFQGSELAAAELKAVLLRRAIILK